MSTFSSEDILGGKEGPSEMPDESVPMWKSYLMKKSWVMCPTPPMCERDRLTPLPFSSGTEEYLRLLRDAQREGASAQSSARQSRSSSRRHSPHSSPKSPPNSPNPEPATSEDDLKDIYINHTNRFQDDLARGVDMVLDWPSTRSMRREDCSTLFRQCSPNKRKSYSVRKCKIGKNSLFSKEVIYTIVMTNIISLLIGTGLGILLARRGIMVSRVCIE